MKTTFTWAICATLVGGIAGVALGYWEARPWTAVGANAPAAAKAKPTTAGDEMIGPVADVAETTFNFDKMESGTSQRHEFPVKNAGKLPLTLEFVSHTCKCTTVELNGKAVEPGDAVAVAPGDKATVLLEWAAKVPAGPFRHGATFTTNDPAHPRLELHVEGDIVESTSLYPSELSFGNIRVGETGKAAMVVAASLDPEVKILSHEIVDDELARHMTIAVEPAKPDELPPNANAGAKIIATYDPGSLIGPFVGSLKMTTNLKAAPNVEVPIYGSVRGDISVFGPGWSEGTSQLRIGQVASGEGTSRKLQVTVRGAHAKETQLSVARVNPPELKATLGEAKLVSDKVLQAPLTVEIPPGTKPMVRAGEDQGGVAEIILATTHPVTKEVRLGVTFTVKP